MGIEDDLAYDGSNAPQKRELTARERDILCRILSDCLVNPSSYVVVRRYPNEIKTLQNIISAIDPRAVDPDLSGISDI